MDQNETKIAVLYGRIIVLALMVLCALYGVSTEGLPIPVI